MRKQDSRATTKINVSLEFIRGGATFYPTEQRKSTGCNLLEAGGFSAPTELLESVAENLYPLKKEEPHQIIDI